MLVLIRLCNRLEAVGCLLLWYMGPEVCEHQEMALATGLLVF
jgi:hypothetical protein